MKVTDITKEDDFTNVSTVKDVIKKIIIKKKVQETFSFTAHHALVNVATIES